MKQIRYILSSFLLIPTLFVSAQTLETIAPSVVQDIVATPGDGFITFEWSPATDEDGIISSYKMYYGTTSVKTIDDSYEAEVDMGSALSYVLSDIAPNTTYYAAITAIDDEGNESENYSLEVSAKTLGGEETNSADGESPKVIEATYVSVDVIQVVMSEFVQGANDASSVSVINTETGAYLDASSVETIDQDIFIYFAPGIITEGSIYEVTVNSIVTDLEGNPVASGITDTVQFTANLIPAPSTCEVPADCFIEGVTNGTNTEMPLDYTVNYFDLLSQQHTGQAFHVVEESGAKSIQLVLDMNLFGDSEVNVGLGAQNVCTYDDTVNVENFIKEASAGSVKAETLFGAFDTCDVYDEDGSFKETTQMGTEGLALVQELVSLLADVTGESSNPFGENKSEEEVEATVYTSAPDTVVPLDVTAVAIDTSTLSSNSVTITWDAASDLDNDIADQILYVKKGSDSYDNGVSLGTNITSYVLVDVEEDASYEVKIVTVDVSGNESFGRSETFSTEGLVASGGSTNIIWVLALVLGFVLSRRKS